MTISETSTHRRLAGGFTLIEVLVTLAVVTILVGTALPLAGALIDQDRQAEVVSELGAIGTALEDYYYDKGAFPSSLSAAAFANVYLQTGVSGTVIKDGWGGDVAYLTVLSANPDLLTVYSRGRDGVDNGAASEDLKILVAASVPGNRRTRERMRVVLEVLANFLEAGGTLTGTWSTDRVNLGLGVEYANDGFGTAFTLSATTYVLRSAGPDRALGTADDLTS
jgi:prepilin-type N-terminal cleavage/methylation domain-containing protein